MIDCRHINVHVFQRVCQPTELRCSIVASGGVPLSLIDIFANVAISLLHCLHALLNIKHANMIDILGKYKIRNHE